MQLLHVGSFHDVLRFDSGVLQSASASTYLPNIMLLALHEFEAVSNCSGGLY